ncbi:MAG: PfkB family carbohydrate kinase, partial [Herbaspirillum sp.]
PGQGLPMFNGTELRQLIELASYVAVNEYEAELLMERTGLTAIQIAERVSAFIVTQSERGADIYHQQQITHIPGVPADAIVDPTGCGDAFRAGMLYGLEQGMDWDTTGRVASVMGAIKIAHQGGQNHRPDQTEIAERFFDIFGYRF